MKRLINKAILIVDDDAGMLRALEKVLTREGALSIPAVWGADAIEILTEREQHVDLVITDLRMPFLTGLTVISAIRKAFSKLPVIVLTAYASPEVREECIRQGADAFLEKPLDIAQLLDAIQGVFASQEAGP